MNHITIELCTEDRARLDRILDALERVAPRQLYALDLGTATEGAENEPEAPKAETPKETQPEPEKPTQPEKTAPTVTVEDVRSKVIQLNGTGKKAEVFAIVKAYASKVTDIPADKLAEVLDKLNALEG